MKVLLLISAIIVIAGAANPKPVNHLNLEDVAGTWYTAYFSPLKLPRNVITCIGIYNVVKGESIRLTNFIDLKGKKANNTIALTSLSNGAEWAGSGVDLIWFDFDEDKKSYGAVGSKHRDLFQIVSRTPQLDINIIKKEIDLAMSQGYTNAYGVAPVNNNCTNNDNFVMEEDTFLPDLSLSELIRLD